ncbi:MAG: hypothetical protein IT348_05845 [Candidatus Eisenbacteria bacterium]|nr:hypothetical protein [Candidatus Eisenbacteria bacterium]
MTHDATFEQFWRAYPRKVAKSDARKAWEKAARIEPDLLALCLAALAWQTRCEQWTRDSGQFIPYPATWLRGERWTDENPVAAREAARAAQEAEDREFHARRRARIDAEDAAARARADFRRVG